MSRPSSRGYGTKMSMGGTGIQSGRNVGTAQRLTTGQRRQVNFGGVGMEHDVQVSNRPVTGKIGGMMGMRVKTAGPQRQVQDNTYWLGVLRAKCDEIKQETDKHKQSIEQHNKDSTTYATLERKYESYIKEVRGLEGQLAVGMKRRVHALGACSGRARRHAVVHCECREELQRGDAGGRAQGGDPVLQGVYATIRFINPAMDA